MAQLNQAPGKIRTCVGGGPAPLVDSVGPERLVSARYRTQAATLLGIEPQNCTVSYRPADGKQSTSAQCMALAIDVCGEMVMTSGARRAKPRDSNANARRYGV
jgi:hypothetical protein